MNLAILGTSCRWNQTLFVCTLCIYTLECTFKVNICPTNRVYLLSPVLLSRFLLAICFVHESESEVTQSCLALWDPMDCSLPGSSVHGICQAILLEWVTISFSRGSSRPRDRTQVSRVAGRRFTIWATGIVVYICQFQSLHLSHPSCPLLVPICLFSTSMSLFSALQLGLTVHYSRFHIHALT